MEMGDSIVLDGDPNGVHVYAKLRPEAIYIGVKEPVARGSEPLRDRHLLTLTRQVLENMAAIISFYEGLKEILDQQLKEK